MAGVSSLLKSAASTRKKVLAQQDAVEAYIWESSAKTYQDYLTYSKYINNRQNSSSDAGDKLSYATKLRSATRSYTSNEIQRQTMRVMEGGSTLQDKQNTVYNLYQRAVGNGDYDLAQNLASQYDSLSVQIQNEARSAIGRATAANSKALKDMIKSITKGTSYVTLPDGSIVKPFGLISQDIKTKGSNVTANVWASAQDTLQQLAKVVEAAYNGATSQEEADGILEKYGGYIDGSKKIDILGNSLSANEIIAAAQNEKFGNPLYSLTTEFNPTTGQAEYKLRRNKTRDYQYIRTGTDAQGNDLYQPVAVSQRPQDVGPNLSTQFTNEGSIIGPEGQINAGTGKVNRSDAQSVQNRLLSMGIQANTNSDGTITVTLPDGNTYNAVITPEGTIRYYGQPGQYSGGGAGLYEINLFGNNAGQSREVAPDETSIFGQPSDFGGLISQSSTAGARTISQYQNADPLGQLRPTDLGRGRISGVTSVPGLVGPISTVNDFTARGAPVLSGLLQSANFTLQAREAERQAAEAQLQARTTPHLQASNTFNLNQTPVQQFAQNGAPIKQLKVAKPVPVPTIKVAPPTPTQKLKVTTNNSFGQLGIYGNYSGGPLKVVSQ